jgi:molybdate transport system substrate-binding protein
MPNKTAGFQVAFVATLAATLVACSRKDSTPPTQKQTTPRPAKAAAEDESLLVSVAASTKEAMESLGKKFTAKTGVEVKVNPGPSNGLANQIIAGAPADLFLSANQQWADEVKKGGHAQEMARLLTNRLVIVVPADNPGGIKRPKDLLSASVNKVALAGETVPAGMYGGQALSKLGILSELDTAGKIVRGQDVRFTLMFVERGETEAGIVYSTDAALASNVKIAHEFDPSLHDEIAYILILLKHGSDNPRAKEFFDYLQSPETDSTYREFGFSRIH